MDIRGRCVLDVVIASGGERLAIDTVMHERKDTEHDKESIFWSTQETLRKKIKRVRKSLKEPKESMIKYGYLLISIKLELFFYFQIIL